MLRPWIIGLIFLAWASHLSADDGHEVRFEKAVRPLLVKYCGDCHSGAESKAHMDLSVIASPESVESSFETFRAALQAIETDLMPPKEEARPTESEQRELRDWFNSRFINIASRAAPLRPRRLSAHEYRQTLRSLIGFDLEVIVTEAEETVSEKSMAMKLLPTDPPGLSGYRNDTHRNPISTIAWGRYNELADLAIEDLFSNRRRTQLETLAGELGETGFTRDHAERLVRNWFKRVYRRPVDASEMNNIISRVRNANDPKIAVQAELKSSLMSPRFLFRSLLTISSAPGESPVDSYELAERLSYFLWADMPDGSLLEAAADRSLLEDAVMTAQVDRMLAARQADNLANDLATQWLSLDEIDEVVEKLPVVVALKSQAVDFIRYLIQEDRPLLELINSKVEFVNVFTARFYGDDRRQLKKHRKPTGIEVQIVPNQRIELVATQDRGGILTMPGILAMNRGAIIRGTWILERVLGQPLPDPPANVGQVQPNPPGQQLTFRQRFEQHRAQASCAVCHDKIDPLGFVLENYSKDGSLISDNPPDTSGRLPSGETFANIQELKKILTTSQRRQLLSNIVQQFLAYALCRRIEYYDQPTVKSIVDKLDASDGHGTYQQLIREIILSQSFRQANFAGARP
jgi:hypothetical protein